MKAITNYINNSILTVFTLPTPNNASSPPPFTMQMTNLPFLTQIFLQMVWNNDLSSPFPLFWHIWACCGCFSEWIEAGKRSTRPVCFHLCGFGWEGTGGHMVPWLVRGETGPWAGWREVPGRAGLSIFNSWTTLEKSHGISEPPCSHCVHRVHSDDIVPGLEAVELVEGCVWNVQQQTPVLSLPLILFFLSQAQQALCPIFPVKNGSYRKVWPCSYSCGQWLQ